jgi:hypothetical protein
MDLFLLTDKINEEEKKNNMLKMKTYTNENNINKYIGSSNIYNVNECQNIQKALDLCNKNVDICGFSILKWYMYSCTTIFSSVINNK